MWRAHSHRLPEWVLYLRRGPAFPTTLLWEEFHYAAQALQPANLKVFTPQTCAGSLLVGVRIKERLNVRVLQNREYFLKEAEGHAGARLPAAQCTSMATCVCGLELRSASWRVLFCLKPHHGNVPSWKLLSGDPRDISRSTQVTLAVPPRRPSTTRLRSL